jgi:hypothetical protein
LGSLAYIGNAAVFDYEGLSLMGGLVSWFHILNLTNV